MDEADIACGNQECLNRRALAEALAAMPQGEAARECEDCGEEIPEDRRRAAPGCTRRIRCQQAFERQRKERG
ncbi:TraR/DksA C4-type zinc finger protein [Desulfobulbus elongatus]|uniref:TraR/DksA C4-type zinc finger protein n=1 Tax=Desulfobulbus elongatus TaxID=53332 RepID=UPI000A818CA2|nr:TraR/DksA C4-type zinc finger protein [Desulfobulbus elongatus]